MKMYKLAFLLHLVLIVLASVYMAIDSYSVLYKKENNGIVFKGLSKILNNRYFDIYGKYTGAETGYGYYAPNVMSSGVLAFEHRGKQYGVPMHNYENTIRYMNLCSMFLQKEIQRMDRETKEELFSKGQDIVLTNAIKKEGNIDSLYYDILLKNMSAKFMSRFGDNDTMSVKLQVYDYPTLADFKASEMNNKAKLLTAYEKKYFTKG
jgi:hypothetical protein